ncbi:MAG: leucyl/phenylalanyl-tRNA--protein transferase [Prosthecochloris sp.]|nr:leucyl/phenylalanyl-tRNA--protein transferase [Prosthecochloris sp.]
MQQKLMFDEVIRAYVHGYFPMGDPEDGKVYWCQPRMRAVVPLESYRPSRVVAGLTRRSAFDVCVNRDFEKVIRSCAEPRKHEKETWISEEIIEVFMALHHHGFAHSVECYRGEEIAGGLYGIALGGAFFGESMFYRQPNASKVAFDWLIGHLKAKGYALLDAQIMNPHLASLGAVEIAHAAYMEQLLHALSKKIHFI